MKKIHQFLKRTSARPDTEKPELYDLSRANDSRRLEKLLASKQIQHVIDDYNEQLREYFAVQNPSRVYGPTFEAEFQEYVEKIQKKRPLLEHGRWVFFPWISTLVHILDEKAFFSVRTARNRNLITEEEQKKFYDAVVGIAGLSVGNSVALALTLQGGARHIKLADHDLLALSNTNRVRAGVDSLGIAKVEVTARQIYLLNPYAKIDLFPEGLTEKNMDRFFKGLTVMIDEIDNLAVKYRIRDYAKKHKLPLVMAADNGDNAVVDVERYDHTPQPAFFHGRMGQVTHKELKELDKFGIGKMITKHVGAENVTDRMKASLLEMGKTIVSWPQLGGAALLNGSAVAYVVRKIVNNQEVEHNRSLLSLDEKLIPSYASPKQVSERAASAEAFKKIFGL